MKPVPLAVSNEQLKQSFSSQIEYVIRYQHQVWAILIFKTREGAQKAVEQGFEHKGKRSLVCFAK